MTESVNDMFERLKKAEEKKKREPGFWVILLILILPSIWWQSWCIATAWDWYAPSFGWPLVTWHQVAGLCAVRGMLFGSPSKGRGAGDMVGWIVRVCVSCALMLGLAYIFRP
jgi:hypothetical protein